MGHDRTRPERPARRERSITRRRLVLDILRHDNGVEVLLRVREPSRTTLHRAYPATWRSSLRYPAIIMMPFTYILSYTLL